GRVGRSGSSGGKARRSNLKHARLLDCDGKLFRLNLTGGKRRVRNLYREYVKMRVGRRPVQSGNAQDLSVIRIQREARRQSCERSGGQSTAVGNQNPRQRGNAASRRNRVVVSRIHKTR